MRIRSLHLTNFRNFADQSIEFSDCRNVILGANAAGKTNILDAIHILGVGRSHRERKDANLVRFGEKFYRVSGVFEHIGVRNTIAVAYGGEGKRIRVNGKETAGSALIGLATVVITSPDDIDLVKGAPSRRRRFLDIAMSQTSRGYLKTLQQYVRALAQRNTLLRRGRETGSRPDVAVWDDALAGLGAEVVMARCDFLAGMEPVTEANFSLISGEKTEIALTYEPHGYNLAKETDIRGAIEGALRSRRETELARGYSLVGPHVDDFGFSYNGRDIRRFGSEGEQRTAVLALRCAEARTMKERAGESPIVLLDDVFAELDDARSSALISLISGFDQIVLTSSRESPLAGERVHRIVVKEGRVGCDV